MEISKRDLGAFDSFIDLATKSGFVNEKTASNRKNVTKLVLTTVPNIDLSDLTKLDIDDIFQRYVVLAASKSTPSTLQGQKSHLKSALREFTTYLADPVHYRPSALKRKARTIKGAGTSTEESSSIQENSKSVESSSIETVQHLPAVTPTIHIDFQIHIAPDTDPVLVDKIFESLSRYFPAK